MTNEEAYNFGKMWMEINDDSKNSKTYKFFELAVKTLEEQKTSKVLHELYQEIKEQYRVVFKHDSPDDWCVKWNECVDVCLNIIDKYMKDFAEENEQPLKLCRKDSETE